MAPKDTLQTGHRALMLGDRPRASHTTRPDIASSWALVTQLWNKRRSNQYMIALYRIMFTWCLPLSIGLRPSPKISIKPGGNAAEKNKPEIYYTQSIPTMIRPPVRLEDKGLPVATAGLGVCVADGEDQGVLGTVFGRLLSRVRRTKAEAHLAAVICPEIYPYANQIIHRRIRSLI